MGEKICVLAFDSSLKTENDLILQEQNFGQFIGFKA